MRMAGFAGHPYVNSNAPQCGARFFIQMTVLKVEIYGKFITGRDYIIYTWGEGRS